jgi:hypothetical protein
MPKTGADEARLLAEFNKGALKSVATQAELAKLKAAARGTSVKHKPGNSRTLAAVRAAKSGKAAKIPLDDL